MKHRTAGVTWGMALLLTGVLGGCGGAAVSKASPTSPFPPFVSQEMISIKPRTTLPLMAPTFVPRTPAFIVGTTKHDRYLTATDQPGGVLAGHYHVNVFVTPTPIPVNAPSLDGMAIPGAEVADFGADRYGSPQQAAATLAGWNADEGFVPTAQDPYRVADVGSGIQARVYSGGAAVGARNTSVQWQAGPWTFEVNNNANNALVPVAQQIVRFVHSHPLPAADAGLVVINFFSSWPGSRTYDRIKGAAVQSDAMWTSGSIKYTVGTGNPLTVLQMTASMRPFRVP